MMLPDLVAIQREIYLEVAGIIKAFAAGSGWGALTVMLPAGVVFGAVHALTPGHSKALLATYVAGSPIGMLRALVVSLSLSATHVAMPVLIAVFALPLVSWTFGSAGEAPELERLSRGLLGLIGAWMIVRAIRAKPRHAHEGGLAGVFAGLIPFPLTLFVMTFAIVRGVPEAGLVFAAAMMAGVATTLSAVAVSVAFARGRLSGLFRNDFDRFERVSRMLEAIAGGILVAVSLAVFMPEAPGRWI